MWEQYSSQTALLPLAQTVSPATQQQAAELVKAAYESDTLVYPLGGGTALDFGLPTEQPGMGLSLKNLNRLVDYPYRDTTITVEAGMTMSALAQTLAEHQQRLPIDVPFPNEATIGGVVATNANGPRRYRWGTVRDYVIGISAIDGRGVLYKGGGRVVKNVAGYDFCKLLTGSLGTLGVITQVTLKVAPIPATSAWLSIAVADLETAEKFLAKLVYTKTTPAAIELLAGPAWRGVAGLAPQSESRPIVVAVGLEGTPVEVDWMVGQLSAEWKEQGATEITVARDAAVASLWQACTQFPAVGDAPLVIKGSVLPGATTRLMHVIHKADPDASILAHAGDGIVFARFPKITYDQIPALMAERLSPAAIHGKGHVVVWSQRVDMLWTRENCWGQPRSEWKVMERVKKAFDPKGILNRGRFVFSANMV